MIRMLTSAVVAFLLVTAGRARGGEGPSDRPLPTPVTRPAMKQMLEALKTRTPRFALPPLSDAEKEKLGARGSGYESRLRALYMPGGGGRGRGAGFSRQADPKSSLSYEFKTRLFWIASRTNNCQY